jgi:hypothetical protein
MFFCVAVMIEISSIFLIKKLFTALTRSIFSQLQIINEKLEVKAESKIGSLDNVGHKPGGGEKKIYDDKEYLKNIEHPVPITPPSQVNYNELF